MKFSSGKCKVMQNRTKICEFKYMLMGSVLAETEIERDHRVMKMSTQCEAAVKDTKRN